MSMTKLVQLVSRPAEGTFILANPGPAIVRRLWPSPFS